jgi:hypothetical protein
MPREALTLGYSEIRAHVIGTRNATLAPEVRRS